MFHFGRLARIMKSSCADPFDVATGGDLVFPQSTFSLVPILRISSYCAVVAVISESVMYMNYTLACCMSM